MVVDEIPHERISSPARFSIGGQLMRVLFFLLLVSTATAAVLDVPGTNGIQLAVDAQGVATFVRAGTPLVPEYNGQLRATGSDLTWNGTKVGTIHDGSAWIGTGPFTGK